MTILRSIEESQVSEDASNVVIENHEEAALELAKRETQVVNVLKVVLVLILLTATALVSAFTYLFTSRGETRSFENNFDQFSNQIISTVQTGAQHRLEAITSLALVIQTYAINSNATWPFVTVPFFEEHILASRSLTDANGVLLFPLVDFENRPAWEKYSIEHRQWVNNSYAAERSILGHDKSVSLNPGEDWFTALWGADQRNPQQPNMSLGIASEIFRTTHPDPNDQLPKIDNTDGPYYPQWQAASMSAYYQSSVNLNYGCFSDFYNSTLIINATGNAVMGLAWADPGSPGVITTMLYPIFDRMLGHGKVVAFLGVDIFWRGYLEYILPPDSGAVDVVIKNSFGEVFTYQVQGQDVVYVGYGDFHDSAFDTLERQAVFGQELMEPISSPTYTGTPLYGDYGNYTLYIYPTHDLQVHYVNKNPVYNTLLVCFVFIFTSLIFVVYDRLVERRQRMVMESAQTSDAIVSSLFPSKVKEKLYHKKDEVRSMDEIKFSSRTVLNGDPRMSISALPNHYGDDMNHAIGPPIAELYPETTILFAGSLFFRFCLFVYLFICLFFSLVCLFV